MKLRIWQISTAIIMALAALLFLGITASQAAPAASTTGYERYIQDDSTVPVINARRRISIPFGIDNNLTLRANGQDVQVTGHGECPDGGETYKIQVTVTQDSTGSHAKGRVDSSCEVELWAVTAETPGPHAFAPGTAEACGKAVIHMDQGGAITYRWCKVVTLE